MVKNHPNHPDWLAIGSTVRTVRKSPTGYIAHQADVRVVRHTAASVFVSYVHSDGTLGARPDEHRYQRVVPKWSPPREVYVAVPKYLDYEETLEQKVAE